MPSEGKHEPCEQRTNGESTGGINGSTRRRFLSGTAASSALALSGCLTAAIKSNSGGKNTIQVAAVEGEGRLFQHLIREHIEDDTDVNVDISLFPYANLFEKTSSVLGTKGTAFDLLFLDGVWVPKFAIHCEPLRQWMPGDYPTDAMIQACLNEGTWPLPKGPTAPFAKGRTPNLYGQAVVGNAQMFAYNRRYYEQVGAKTPPETWDDVLTAGKRIDEQIDGVDGYVIRGKRGNPITTNYFSIGTSIAGNMFDENWRYTWDEKQGIDALQFYTDDLKSISPTGVASFGSDQVLNRLGEGTAAQGFVWPAAASILLDSEGTNDIAFTVSPKGTRRAPLIGNWVTAINTYISDAKKEAAGKVIDSFISRKSQEKYVELGGIPFRHDIFQNNINSQPWFSALYNTLKQTVQRPRTPLWTEIQITLGRYLNTALTGESSPKMAMTNANDELEQMLKQAGYYEN